MARYYANTAERHLASRRRRGALPFLTAAYEHHHNGNGVTVYVDHDGTADGVRDDDGNGHHPAAGSGA